MSREEEKFKIIEKCNPRLEGKLKYSNDEITCQTAFYAMDLYAQQEAIAFKKFWDNYNPPIGEFPSDEELYSIFQQSQKQNQNQ